MNPVTDFLQQRRSCARLSDPAPPAGVLESVFAAAVRAPDHANLKPARFLLIEGAAREKLGDAFVAAARAAGDESADPARLRALPMRAPLLIAVICSPTAHPKVPECEQLWSVACAAYALLLGLEAEGYGGMWRTGQPTYQAAVAEALGLAGHETLMGFLYVGTPEGEKRPAAAAAPQSQWVRHWSGVAPAAD